MALVMALTVGLSPALLPPPAHAAKAKVTVSIKASKTTVTTGTTVKVSGSTSKAVKGVNIRLQLMASGTWKTLSTKSHSKKRTYSFSLSMRQGAQRYRVLTSATTKTKAATSRTLTLTGKKAAPATPVSPELRSAREVILDDTNAYRARAGLKPLRLHAALNAISQTWATSMAVAGRLAHNPSYAALTPGAWTGVAENVAEGYTPGAVTKAWFDSPGHKANLLGKYTHIGIGYVTDRTGRAWLVQNFARY